MKMRSILPRILVMCALVTLYGCQGTLCPEAGQLADQARVSGLASEVQRERLRAAIDSYRQCRTTKERSKDTSRRIDAELADLTRTYAALTLEQVDRMSLRTVPEYSRTISELEQAANYDDSEGTLRKALAEYRGRREKLVAQVQSLLDTATQQRSMRDWGAAVSAVDGALALDPPNSDAARLRQQILSQRDDYYARTLREMCRNPSFEKCMEANSLFREFNAGQPRPDGGLIAELRTLIDRARRGVVEQLIAQKKYFSAYTLVRDSQDPEYAGLLADIIKQGGAFYLTLANDEYRNVRDFHAYAAVVKAVELLGPDNEEAFRLQRDGADRVDDSIQIKIGIAPFNSSGDEPDIGKRLTNDLLSQLHPLLPYGVQMEEREKVEFGIEKVGSTEAVRLLGLRWAIFGDVDCKIVREHNTHQITAWAPVVKTIPNPQYETELKMIAAAGKNRDRLPQPRPTITAKVSEKVEYSEGEDSLHGQLACSVRIYSAGAGYVTSPKSFSTSREAKDSFCDGVPEANVPRDPLELPSQLAFLDGMREEMVKQITDWLAGNFSDRQRQFAEEAEYRIQRKEWDEAAKAAVQGYFYCLRAKVPQDDPHFVRLRKLALFDLTEGTPHAEATESGQRSNPL
jgi:hypothetical protein